jgi:hypothetical protein
MKGVELACLRSLGTNSRGWAGYEKEIQTCRSWVLGLVGLFEETIPPA